MQLEFSCETHKTHYNEILSRMKSQDCYHQSLAYLFALDNVCFEHLDQLFDFFDDIIVVDGMHGGWHTSSSKRTVRLAFNLRNSFVDPDNAVYSTPTELFSGSFAEYYCYAIMLRFK